MLTLVILVQYNEDTDPRKLNLGVGAYRTDEGKPWVLDSVVEAEKIVREQPAYNHEYAGIEGVPALLPPAASLIFGADCSLITEGRIMSCQSISGSGAIRLGFETVKMFAGNQCPGVLIPNPTWGNHTHMATSMGFNTFTYRYWSEEKKWFDVVACLEDLAAAPNGCIALLHCCAHNPTGADPSEEAWKEIITLCVQKGHMMLFDTAYQGFATGDVEADVFPIRMAVNLGHQVMVSQSFAKNLGLYGERTGCLHVTTSSKASCAALLSQVKRIARASYSSPPVYGAKVAATVLTTPALRTQWEADLRTMVNRMNAVREALVASLERVGAPGTWTHITRQRGMFSYTGLTAQQSEAMSADHHIYMTSNGRISLAGMKLRDADYVAEAIKAVMLKYPA